MSRLVDLVYTYAQDVRSFTRYMLQRDLNIPYNAARLVINMLLRDHRLVEIVPFVYTFRELLDKEDRGACLRIYTVFRELLEEQTRYSRGSLLRIDFSLLSTRLSDVFEIRDSSVIRGKRGRIYEMLKTVFLRACTEAGLVREEDFFIVERKTRVSLGYIRRGTVEKFLCGLARVLKLEKTLVMAVAPQG